MDFSLDQVSLSSSMNSLREAQAKEASRAAANGNDAEAAKGFQKMLATMLVKELRRGLDDGMFGGGPGADVYEAWFDEHLADSLTERDALGMSGMIRASIGRMDVKANESEGNDQ